MTGRLFYWVADWNLTRAEAELLLGGPVGDMVDCTHGSLEKVKATSVRRLAGYVTGSADVRWTPEDFTAARYGPGGERAFLRIDQSNQDLPLLSDAKAAKDVETGASLIGEAVTVARQRLGAGDDYTIYIERAELGQLESSVARAGLPAGQIAAYQWASPTSNPNTLLPGTGLTLADANADLSVVKAAWLPLPAANVAAAEPASGTFNARLSVTGRGTWSVREEAGSVDLGGPDDWWEVKVGVNRSTGAWRASPLPVEK